MLGLFTNDKKNPIRATIPKKDMSLYAHTRWKFMLFAPFNVSNKCCNVMKKAPAHKYEKKTKRVPITAEMADESRTRTQKWLQYGCNGFERKGVPKSTPMAFWTEQDVLLYIKQFLDTPLKDAWANICNPKRKERRKARKYLKKNNYRRLSICSVYGDVVIDYEAEGNLEGQMAMFLNDDDRKYKTTGCSRTGCMLCGFGCHLEKSPNRFEQLKETHPGMYKLLDVVKNNGVTMREAIEWMNENGGTDIKL